MEDFKISRVTSDYPYDLLYLADPSREAVSYYLERGECWCAALGGTVVGLYVLLPTRPFTAELVNLAVAEDFQNRGIGKRLIGHAVENARGQGYGKLEIGTGNPGIIQMSLYQKCGFRFEWIDRDFFPKHYPGSVVEDDGQECRDMIRMGMDL